MKNNMISFLLSPSFESQPFILAAIFPSSRAFWSKEHDRKRVHDVGSHGSIIRAIEVATEPFTSPPQYDSC